MLHSAGWKASVGQLEPCTNDNACEYECSLHRPASYLAALLLHQELLAKGVPCVRHDGVDSYYRSLITLMDARLTDFLSKMGDGVPDENACRECSGVLEDLSGGDADADVLVSLAIDDGSGGERAAASSANLASEVVSWRRAVAHIGGDSPLAKIYIR